MMCKGLGTLLITLVSCIYAQTIPELISRESRLSELARLIDSVPSFSRQLAQADNFTFLAPMNEAISLWAKENRSSDDVKAILQYHLLHGNYPTASLPETPQFLPSSLEDVTYSNVTGGQRVEAYNNGQAIFRSALNITSNVVSPASPPAQCRTTNTNLMKDIIATGGIIQIVDTVLQIPLPSLTTLTASNLSYIIGLASKDSFLSVSSRPFIDTLTSSSDLTYFVPNSAKALADFNVTGLTRDQINQWALYLAVDKLVYSTDFVDGMELKTWNGANLLVTVRDGEIWINNAKLTGRDHLVANGVFHVLDDLISPWNITRPSFPPVPAASTNQSSSITTHPSSTATLHPSSTAAPSTTTSRSHLKPALKTGISVGAVSLALIVTLCIALFVFLRERRVKQKLEQSQSSMESWPKDRGSGEWIWRKVELHSESAQMPELGCIEGVLVEAVELEARCGDVAGGREKGREMEKEQECVVKSQTGRRWYESE